MTVLNLAGLVAAVLAGTGGCLAGVRAADWVNHLLGRNVPTDEQLLRLAEERAARDTGARYDLDDVIAEAQRPAERPNRSGSVEDTGDTRTGHQGTTERP